MSINALLVGVVGGEINIVELPRALLPDDLLSLLQRLQELHLQENSIELLEDQALAGLSSLALLDLSRNQLGTISREALQPLSSLQVLRLTGNTLPLARVSSREKQAQVYRRFLC